MSKIKSSESKKASALSKNESSAKYNALVDGVYARDVLLPGEDPEEFLALHRNLRSEYGPSGQSEEEEVLKLANLYWRLRRLYLSNRLLAKGDSVARVLTKSKEKGWRTIRRAFADAHVSYDKTSLATIGTTVAQAANEITLRIMNANAEDAARYSERLKSIGAVFEERVIPMQQNIERILNTDSGLQKAYSLDELERFTRVEAIISARIEKTLRGLFGIQEYKRLKAAVNSQPSVPVTKALEHA
jgi:hypothetical protein